MLVKYIGSFDSGLSASWHGILEAMGLIPNEFCKKKFHKLLWQSESNIQYSMYIPSLKKKRVKMKCVMVY